MLPGEERPATQVAPQPSPTLTGQLDAYLAHLTVERGVAANTLASYRRDLLRYMEHLTDVHVGDLADVHEHHISDFAASLRRGDPERNRPALAASSAARALIAVRGLHRFAAAEGQTPVDVARTVKPPAPGRRLPKALTVDQVTAILEAAAPEADAPRDLRDRALLELLYSTGARISEAVGLDVDDLDTESRTVLLRGKGGKQRLVPVGRPALGALDAYLVRGRPTLATGRTAAVFLNARGGRLSRQSAWKVLQTAAERAGVDVGVSPHTLRHSFATHLLDGGADVRVVQELLGHASVTTTQIYTLVTAGALREVWAQAHPRAR
ncbi:tyrosine recombinase xerd [Rhodococcus gordoniae]|uniref:Tyrosine recombinase XerD n=1 Tax=Rhodococcus gordoniae TaxID=223392 RepID=A0A379LWE3_9NOCA|nr:MULTISPECIES: site-specific tyrosine recombinase XerD [Rhodococcus]UTT46958.1 site-specific tyrosine recombinase XerD [Rhodococcus gordoniae]SUE14212.1 tyrosine recombinase xerd [Rhodococcus gordoniae]